MRLPAPVYPGHFQTRSVWGPGLFRFNSRRVFLTVVLHGQEIGLEEVDDGIWSIYFYDVLLGRLDERDYRVYG